MKGVSDITCICIQSNIVGVFLIDSLRNCSWYRTTCVGEAIRDTIHEDGRPKTVA